MNVPIVKVSSSCSACSDASPSSESVFVASQTEIPACTSKWTEDTLSSLQIAVIKSIAYTPLDLLNSITKKDHIIDTRVKKISEHLVKYMPFALKDLDGDFNSISYDRAVSFLYNAHGQEMQSFEVQPLSDSSEDMWRYTFRIHGQMFAKKLIYMTLQKKNGNVMSEIMFQQLFEHFAAMFGLHSISAPALTAQKITIGSVTVKSAPDLIFYDLPNLENNDPKIFAICKVKKECKHEEERSLPKTRRYEEGKRPAITHLNSSLTGQHGGDLLTHFLSSKDSHHLLGFIIQETFVTFTLFTSRELDIDEIKRGDHSFPGGTEPTVKFSKPFNYLKADDRLQLIEPLLKLGFHQCKCVN